MRNVARLPARASSECASLPRRYAVSAVRYVDELPAALASAPVVHLLCGVNSDSGAATQPASFPGLEALRCDTSSALHTALCACRAIKSPAEVKLLRYVCKLSSEAHIAVMKQARAGMFEYQLESLFMHHCYMWGGARHVGYTSICACGPHGAVLHYGHAGAPNDAELRSGDMALLDMGAEYACYGADITRSFPIGGAFSADQALVYNAVLAAQDAVFAAVRPGVEWTDMHRLAERALLAALTKCGSASVPACGCLLTACPTCAQGWLAARHARGAGGGAIRCSLHAARPGTLAGALSASTVLRVCANRRLLLLLNNSQGIDTHDVGGYPAGRQRVAAPGICKLRMNRRVEAGMVLTVEPGCYFIAPLLAAAAADAAQAPLLVPEALARFAAFGGVRLEDDIVVTADGMENLTLCPRTVAEVEAVMRGAPWPPEDKL